MTVTHDGHDAGRSALTSRFAHVFRLTDGLVTAFESVNDTHPARQAMA